AGDALLVVVGQALGERVVGERGPATGLAAARGGEQEHGRDRRDAASEHHAGTNRVLLGVCRVIMVSEANEPGSESGKRSDDRRGAARGTRAGSWTPQEGGASTPLAAPGSFAAAAMITRQPPSAGPGARQGAPAPSGPRRWSCMWMPSGRNCAATK